jgi:hypothetical protein
MTWILVYFFYSHATGNIPGFQSEADCKKAGFELVNKVTGPFGSSAVGAVCIPQLKGKR